VDLKLLVAPMKSVDRVVKKIPLVKNITEGTLKLPLGVIKFVVPKGKESKASSKD
jgi:hypothetical protein